MCTFLPPGAPPPRAAQKCTPRGCPYGTPPGPPFLIQNNRKGPKKRSQNGPDLGPPGGRISGPRGGAPGARPGAPRAPRPGKKFPARGPPAGTPSGGCRTGHDHQWLVARADSIDVHRKLSFGVACSTAPATRRDVTRRCTRSAYQLVQTYRRSVEPRRMQWAQASTRSRMDLWSHPRCTIAASW